MVSIINIVLRREMIGWKVQRCARGCTWKEASEAAGVAEVTISLWKKNPAFVDLIQQSEKAFYQSKVKTIDEVMNGLENRAVTVLEDMLREDKPDAIKLRAIQLILNHQNNRKSVSEGQLLVNFNMPEPGMPEAESIEDGDTTGK